MINIDKLLEAKRVEVSFIDTEVDKNFVKNFRKEHQLTQVALANILGVTKKAIEKWEQGANKVNGSSAVLLKLLQNNPELFQQVYSVKYEVEGTPMQENYRVIATRTVTDVQRTYRAPMAAKLPFVAML